MAVKLEHLYKANSLFHGWKDTSIYSCLQGIMGSIYVDNSEEPVSAMAVLGDFCFMTGKPNKDLVLFEPLEVKPEFMIAIPKTKTWGDLIENTYGQRANKIVRYAIKKDQHQFDIPKLRQAVLSLKDGFSLEEMNEENYELCKSLEWSFAMVSQYETYDKYQQLGLGYVIKRGDLIVAGASSYSTYLDGIEIEIDTHEDYRRNGFAYVCAARLLLECFTKNKYPSWDAHNEISVALAQKLGYIFDHEYDAYEIYLGS